MHENKTTQLYIVNCMKNVFSKTFWQRLNIFSPQTVKKAAPTEPTPQKVPKAKEEKVGMQ